MKKRVNLFYVVVLTVFVSLSIGGGNAWSFPGLLQQATRSGFWTNQLPDGPLLLQHYYHYMTDESWDEDGDEIETQDTDIAASFTRLIYTWHFGESKQYQYVLEGIIPLFNVSIEESSDGANDDFNVSGLGNPFVFTEIGWNNPSKTSHYQFFTIWQLPFGDSDLENAGVISNNHALQPGFATQQRWGDFQLDASIGYFFNFEDLDSDKKARDYLEINPIVTYHFPNFKFPWWVYVQGDYARYFDGDDKNGENLDNDGYNIVVAPGAGVAIRPNMHLDLKYAMDVDGENTQKGNAINLRFLWVF